MTEKEVTSDKAAELIGVTRDTITRWCREGKLKGQTVDGITSYRKQWLVDIDSLMAWDRVRPKKRGGRTNAQFGQIKPREKRTGDKEQAEINALLARADALVQAKRRLVLTLFPNPRPGEVEQFCLDYLVPTGRTCIETYNVNRFNGRKRILEKV